MIAPRPWTYSYLPTDSAPGLVGDFAPLVALWQSRAGGRPIPSWSDFDVVEFAGWHDMMVLDEVSYDPLDALTLIWGSRLAEVCGYQPRGTRLRQSTEMRGLIDQDFAFWERVCLGPSIGITKGQLDWRGREHVTIERLYLPCASQGGPVDQVVSFCRLAPLRV